MVKQYPYDLYVTELVGGGVDENGYPLPQTEQDIFASKCRDEVNTLARTLVTVDGAAYYYDYLIQLPLSCPNIEVGKNIKVKSGNFVRIDAEVKRFQRDQMHCRIWV